MNPPISKLPSIRNLEYLVKIFQDLASSGKIFEEIQDKIQDLVKISKVEFKIFSRYPILSQPPQSCGTQNSERKLGKLPTKKQTKHHKPEKKQVTKNIQYYLTTT